MKNLYYFNFVIILLSLQLATAQNNTISIPMNASNWEAHKGTSTFETFDNKETLVLNGKVILKNKNFSNGTISVDVYANTSRSFAGIIFRKQQKTMEEVYMRLHKSNQVDAIQYSPTYNEELTWQLYKEYQANVTFKNKGWNKLRIEINKNNAVIFVNDKKVLTIDNLRTTHSTGEIGLFSLFKNRFSNFKVTHKEAVNISKTDAQPNTELNFISRWNITEAFPYVEGKLNFNNFSKEKYRMVTTEKSGLLPFSKYIQKPSAGNFEKNKEVYAVASNSIVSTIDQVKIFSFDYSDKIIVYLNGKEIFKGNNAFRSKGMQYQGHLDIDANKLYLNLNKGENTFHCVVIDKANGWGLIGKLE
ncbi:family 16 glycoside hydrolase [Kordia sp.]|uniref:family 16 glycoside hydrolase n=1 Tax=Kordia sp. TaxID=1965332 RepID=UPI003D2679ED